MKLAVAGTGYVGLVAGVCFAEKGHTVTCVDVDEQKVAMMRGGESPIYEVGLEELLKKNIAASRLFFTTDYASAYADADAIFIGVGTPELPDGSANLSYIAAVCREIAESVTHDCLVVVKSTVPVGTNDKVEQYIKDNLIRDVKVRVASNPEFLAQGNAVHDTMHATRIIIGTEDEEAERILLKIYAPFDLPIVSVSRRSAEMIKYACNNFLALKISYMNDIANLCERVGASVDDVAEGMRYDPRIGAKFLKAGVGYGGSCFPKDTKALCFLAEQHGYHLRTVDAAVAINAEQKTKLFEKAKKRFMSFENLRVAVLGLAFKPGTDDLREAPAIDNVRLLLEHGAQVICYDPVAGENFKKKFPNVTLAASAEEALQGAFCCFVFTEWEEIVRLSPEVFRSKMHVPLVYDGRNIFDTDTMRRGGVEYYSIGR
ncbi:MAG: UDP-glucose/GDP-mannose dehydrogenase family protein [Clostridiaceae bacterium]